MKKTMTLNLPAEQMDALSEMAKRAELSKTSLIRQALGLYQLCQAKQASGLKMAWIDKSGIVEQNLIIGCGWEGMD